MTDAPPRSARSGAAIRGSSADRYRVGQLGDDSVDSAEALVREARRRHRLRLLGWASGIFAALATVGGLAAADTFRIDTSRNSGSSLASLSRGATGAAATSRDILQFRPSLAGAPLASKNCPVSTSQTPPANRAAWVRWRGGCVHDGPAILAISAVRSVTVGYSCDGTTVWVNVQLLKSDVTRFDRMVRKEGSSIVGSVIRDLQLQLYTGDLRRTQTALTGNVNIAGGLPETSPLPQEIAKDLGEPLHRAPKRWEGFCDGS